MSRVPNVRIEVQFAAVNDGPDCPNCLSAMDAGMTLIWAPGPVTVLQRVRRRRPGR